jgi:hypothetical protein
LAIRATGANPGTPDVDSTKLQLMAAVMATAPTAHANDLMTLIMFSLLFTVGLLCCTCLMVL